MATLLSVEHRAAVSSSHWLCQYLTSAAAFHLPALSSDFTSLFSPFHLHCSPPKPIFPQKVPGWCPFGLSLAASTSVEGWENSPLPLGRPLHCREKKTRKGEILVSLLGKISTDLKGARISLLEIYFIFLSNVSCRYILSSLLCFVHKSSVIPQLGLLYLADFMSS